ncbi:TPA: ATP-dependent protease ATPase subunit HslU [Bacillus thuringiensis]|jgi:ATP-dependent HslUV protease ATP-binding subunit HslU|uniref:ATP-dependent protease ATPase subunit HslU n=8 Tax=Bacillus cereus group TaxID=86661 RepID=A0A9X0VIU4_BACTU|nr:MULTISPECIES: ATP-dependent protease ATPase subunit HslU [Bacillus]ANN33651.1 HslU--HslV peptidase ATPase subunit [Bacillus thuringiensis serovar coreanensis]MCU7391104.1 ATP-dependent protease ATPase subunit HslU [Bacillus sp. ST24]NIE92084.1 ATP-dependent protease ATPase subunit HslU [Bacillus sp. Ab-1751]OUB16983.1 HslU--HslV peptidase ATPase subunit [Bacillus thuringiensis serovar yunnanensis]CGG45130.1 ATP-dependent Clp protease ATP-binding subunit ClpX [Streptococcus pneumoniae]BCA32
MHLHFTPRQIVEKLDQYIIGQKDAKKAVAVALRNRYRRSKLAENLRDEIAPKNILMIGPTGVGKTEVARRMAKLVGAPFIKVEATKFTEVGYVGRDVESMVRDLVETSVRIVKEEMVVKVQDKAEEQANQRLVEILVPSPEKQSGFKNPLEMLFGGTQNSNQTSDTQEDVEIEKKRQDVERKLAAGLLEDEIVSIEVTEQQSSMFDMLQGTGMEQMGMNFQDALGSFMPKKTKKRKLSVKEARKLLTNEEAQRLIDMDEVTQEAVYRAEQLGIIFIDEIDKIAGKQSNSVDVSREGVQRDILPIVEGSNVATKYGSVKTDYILFVAAGAFHMSKPSDLIPELQGRFPIRVELTKLSTDDFVKILIEPDNALIKQYMALLATEGIEIEFSDEAIRKIAEIAYQVNQDTDNIGARRLHTIMEKLLEDLSFEASEITLEKITITPQYVEEKLATIAKNKDVSQFIL